MLHHLLEPGHGSTAEKYSNPAARHRPHPTKQGLQAAPTTGTDPHATRSHRGGHWFDPSIAHPAQRPVAIMQLAVLDLGAAASAATRLGVRVEPLAELAERFASSG